MTSTFIRVIGDYGHLGDMAFAEVTDNIHARLHAAHIHDYHLNLSSVPAFDTYATGFMLAQLALNSCLGEAHLFYVNTAPRKDNPSARQNNEGEGLVYARLTNGVQVIAVNSGHSLTLIKPFSQELRRINVDIGGSQFRSRDIFPQALADVISKKYMLLGDDISASVEDDIPSNCVLYTDGYGNMKCNIPPKEIETLKGKHVHICVHGNSEKILIRIGDGIFDVPEGGFCFARGSSGWPLPNGGKRQFCEIIKRGGSAAQAFGNPLGGSTVEWHIENE